MEVRNVRTFVGCGCRQAVDGRAWCGSAGATARRPCEVAGVPETARSAVAHRDPGPLEAFAV